MGCVASKETVKGRRPVPPPPSGFKRYKALYDFQKISDDDLPFKRGDLLTVCDDQLEEEWWKATHVKSKKTGFIPSNYVKEDNDSPESQDWWFEYDRNESNKMLLLAGNCQGTFLVRQASDKKSLVLSIRDEDIITLDVSIKHYKIKKMDNGEFYITSRCCFKTLIDLIDHYQDSSKGLCSRLTKPCSKHRPVVPFRELEINREAIVMGEVLGAGFFGKVYKGKLRNVVDVAIKVLKSTQMSSVEFLKEAQIMHKLSHRRLVGLIHVCTDTEPILIVTEFMANGSLLKYLRSDEGKNLTFLNIVNMAAQIADGMAYLERENLIHRDLRADNVLVDENCDVKVADFGLARELLDNEDYDACENTKFPIKWTAPEAAIYRKFSIKSDVWSFGILLYELVTYGKVPYIGKSGKAVINFIEKGGRMEKPEGCEESYYNFMLQCWEQKSANRPTFESLYHIFEDYIIETEGKYECNEQAQIKVGADGAAA